MNFQLILNHLLGVLLDPNLPSIFQLGLWESYFEQNNQQVIFFLCHIEQQRNKYGAPKKYGALFFDPKKGHFE
jgi:3-phenylpropionate/cinnamic acid dioxygenase small subunit